MEYHIILLIILGFLAGILGSVLGIGGGIIITPVLTSMMGIDIKYAIGASIVSVIATSSGATIMYLNDELINLRLAMFLELFTATGAIVGALTVGFFNGNIILVLFGLFLFFSAFNMFKKMRQVHQDVVSEHSSKLAEKFQLNGSYYDRSFNKRVDYKVTNTGLGSTIMFGAGFASGLLGIGSGAFKVMALDNVMKIPLKPSSATSNLMMGVTGAASALIYFFNGDIKAIIAGPLIVGILFGSRLGAKIMPNLHPKIIRIIFIPILLYMGAQMFLKGLGVHI